MNKTIPPKPLYSEITFRGISLTDIPQIVSAFTAIGWNKSPALYKKYFEEQENNQRCVWVAFKGNDFAGYVTLKWLSDYGFFREQGIPEISDLNVLPKFRMQGMASHLLDKAEAAAFKKSSLVGIGVGLSADYGNAQKLYVKRGYIPDGRGITYNYLPLKFSDSFTLDDNLILWFTKKVT